MLYTAPIESISWEDIQAFCREGVVEGTYLDYKSDFPADLARTLAAMANTLGGVVLIGVNEGQDGRPILPVCGVPMTKGLAERVTNIVLSNITPPVFPEVTVCADDDKQKAIVVIRVPQSPEGPHAIQSNTRVYVRTGNRNNPETLATVSELEWLQRKRARSLDLKTQLMAQALSRSNVLFGDVNLLGQSMPDSISKTANVVLRVVPTFPGKVFVQPPELRSMFRSIQVPDYYGTDSTFPLGGRNAVLLQDGAYTSATLEGDNGRRNFYAELSVFGQYCYRQTLAFKYKDKTLIRASELFCRLDEFSRSAKKFYSAIGYQGFVSLLCSLYGSHTAQLGQWTVSEYDGATSACPDESIGHEEEFLVGDWESGAEKAITSAARTIGWAYNYEIDGSLLHAYYAKYRRGN